MPYVHAFSLPFPTTHRPPTPLSAGLSWRTDDIYHAQPDFPVLFLATRNETYAREVERHFGGQGYFVRSTRTLTRLAKMTKTTRPEGILISDHLSTSHILGFLASLKENPDLWLIPILIVSDPASSSSSSSSSSPPPPPPSSPSPQAQQYHHEMLRLGVRAIIHPTTPLPTLQALLEGARLTRSQVESLVDNLHGAILHFAQHRRRLLPSTMLLEGPPPSFTTTEQEVLNLVSRGMTDQQIAHSLGCTSATVGNAIRSLCDKLEVDMKGELTRVALDNDLLTE